MKKFTKIFLILATIFCIIGIGFSTAGLAMGATWDTVKTAGNSVDWAYLTRFWHWNDRDDDYDDDDDDDYWDRWADKVEERVERTVEDIEDRLEGKAGIYGNYPDQQYTYPVDEIRELEVELRYDNLILEASQETTDQVQVLVSEDSGGNVTIEKDAGDKKLSIKSNKRQSSDRTVTLIYPKDMRFDEVDIEVDTGQVTIEGDFYANELDAGIGAGEMITNGKISCNSSSWKVGAGTVTLDLLASSDTELECGVGNLTATLAGRQQDYNYELKYGIGDMNIGSDYFSGLAGKKKINNGAAMKIEAECGVGELTLDFEN